MKKNILPLTLLFLLHSCFLFKDKATPAAQDSSTTTTSINEVVGEDPLFSSQWHLENPDYPDIDLNIGTVWSEDSNYGDDILINIIDDGLEIAHEDLIANIGTSNYNINFVTSSNDPTDGYHGTSVAGVIAARDRNSIGIKGVAPRAKIIGRNMLAKATTLTMAQALTANASEIYVSNNSWGFADDTGELSPREEVWSDSIDTGLRTGRNGKGTVFVWSAGNGGQNNLDNSNYDGYANYYGVISVCAVGNDGARAVYSEKGSNLWVCAPSLGDFDSIGIVTTDRTGEEGENSSSTSTDLSDKSYTGFFSGTSAAAPMVSGVAALVLKANSSLSWRDVKIILAQSAQKINPNDSGWSTNQANYEFNHDFGFGLVHAQDAVTLAKTWTNVGPLVTEYFPTSAAKAVGTSINPGSNVSDSMTVSGLDISKIEYVVIVVNATYGNWGELAISLDHESEDSSILSQARTCTSGCQNTVNSWEFGDARHLGESPNGVWTLNINTSSGGSSSGTLDSWRLIFYGE